MNITPGFNFRYSVQCIYVHAYFTTSGNSSVQVINPRQAAAPRVIVGQSVCLSVCMSVYSESAHLDGIALCLYYG